MELQLKVKKQTGKPVAAVFEAVVNPDHLLRCFTSAGSSALQDEATVL